MKPEVRIEKIGDNKYAIIINDTIVDYCSADPLCYPLGAAPRGGRWKECCIDKIRELKRRGAEIIYKFLKSFFLIFFKKSLKKEKRREKGLLYY